MDVTSLHNRRATERWERTSVGDMFERLTWSYPDKEAIVGWDGAFADPALAASPTARPTSSANRVANAILARGLERGDRVLMFCENSVEAYVDEVRDRQGGADLRPREPDAGAGRRRAT